MSSFLGLFGFKRQLPPDQPQRSERLVIQRVLHRVLSFTGHTIDDVVNDPLVKRKILGFYKLHKWVDREAEVSTLERQWNARM